MEKKFKLSNGVKIPFIGFGTWMIDNDSVVECIKLAIESGYTHFDTAQAYENESGVGKGIKLSGVSRENLFVTSKLAAEIKDYDKAIEAIDVSLDKIDLGYLDLMLIHSPRPWIHFNEDNDFYEGNLQAWKALEEKYKEGKLKSIGVSNFGINDLKNIIDNCEVKPMVNQVLAHIGNLDMELIKFCKENGILVQAYSPFGHGDMFKDERLNKIAKKYNVSVARLAVRFLVQLELLPLPKASTSEHMLDNKDIDFEINENDMEYLINLEFKGYSEENKVFPVYQQV